MDINDIRLRDIYTRTQISFEVKKVVNAGNSNTYCDGTIQINNKQFNKHNSSSRNLELDYYLFSESEDDEMLNSNKNPSLNESYVLPDSKKNTLLSSQNEQSLETKKESNIMQQYQGKVSAATISDLEGIDMMGLPVDLDDSCGLDLYSELNNVADQPVTLKNTSLTAQTTPMSSNPSHKIPVAKELPSNKGLNQDTHACFLSLIRDIFCSTPNHRMKMEELKEKIDIWSSSPIAALNEWFFQSENWLCLVPSAINFLTGEYSELQDDFVPYIEYKINLNIYQWIGAGRDTDNHLRALCKTWLVRKSISEKVDLQFGKCPVENEEGKVFLFKNRFPHTAFTYK